MRFARGCLLGSALLAVACGAGVQGATPLAGPCERERAQCESGCESRILPGSSEKAPELRGEMEADRCRDSCRTSYDACRRSGALPFAHPGAACASR